MSKLVPPHGADSLKPLLLPAAERGEEADRARRLKQVPLSIREVSDLFAISGTRLREMFANGEAIPPEFSRPEVVDVLREYYDGVTRQ